jgi:hypothetical protein
MLFLFLWPDILVLCQSPWPCDLWPKLAGIVGLNCAGDMDICFSCELCIVR